MRRVRRCAILKAARAGNRHGRSRTPDLPFLLFSYEKHELIASPMARLEYLLFVVSGDVHIFGLHRDGGAFPVNIASKGRRFAQNRKRTLPPCRILRVTHGERCVLTRARCRTASFYTAQPGFTACRHSRKKPKKHQSAPVSRSALVFRGRIL